MTDYGKRSHHQEPWVPFSVRESQAMRVPEMGRWSVVAVAADVAP
jgi:hypothetical protein